MNDEKLYEYAVVRYMPRIERGEFINIGLIMMCKRHRWLRLQLHIDPSRLDAMKDACCADELTAQLRGFETVAAGGDGPLASLPAEERFRWLTAVRSACIQCSRPHPGTTDNLDTAFDRLFAELVL